MTVRTSRPNFIVIHFMRKDELRIDDVYSVEWMQTVVRIVLNNESAVTYPYREIFKIVEFENTPPRAVK